MSISICGIVYILVNYVQWYFIFYDNNASRNFMFIGDVITSYASVCSFMFIGDVLIFSIIPVTSEVHGFDEICTSF